MQACFLITRPKAQANKLAELIKAQPAEALLMPTLEIIPVLPDALMIERLQQADIVLYTSANAVTCAQEYRPNTKVLLGAIGPATQQALKKNGLSAFIPADAYHSEGLLACPELQKIADKSIAIVCGRDPKPILAQGLHARGAEVHEIVVYERKMPVPDNKTEVIQRLNDATISAIVVSSKMCLHHLCLMLADEAGNSLTKTPLIVINQAMVAQAEALHFEQVYQAENATDEAIIDLIQQHF